MTTAVRRLLVPAMCLSLLLVPAACGSSADKTASDAKAQAAGGSDSAASSANSGSSDSESGPAKGADPCSLYSIDDMKAQMGADDVTAEKTFTDPPTCEYKSAAHYLSVELAVLNEDQLASTPRNPNAYTQDSSATLLDVSGIGDEVFGYSTKGGVTLVTRVGEGGYSVLLTNAGGGADAGKWTDEAAMVDSAKAILTSVAAG